MSVSRGRDTKTQLQLAKQLELEEKGETTVPKSS